jgi:23S rRNA (uracil1939-C5)-methyltransferase
MLENGGDHLVDAYCGAGFFAKRLLGKFRDVTGIEWSGGAVRAARASARAGENYLEGAVEVHLSATLAAFPAAETTLLLDPPAGGLSHEVVEAILANPPATVVCISCDPPTLARDLKRLSPRFLLNHVQPVDMFPQTAEIESVALLKIP